MFTPAQPDGRCGNTIAKLVASRPATTRFICGRRVRFHPESTPGPPTGRCNGRRRRRVGVTPCYDIRDSHLYTELADRGATVITVERIPDTALIRPELLACRYLTRRWPRRPGLVRNYVAAPTGGRYHHHRARVAGLRARSAIAALRPRRRSCLPPSTSVLRNVLGSHRFIGHNRPGDDAAIGPQAAVRLRMVRSPPPSAFHRKVPSRSNRRRSRRCPWSAS